MVGVGPDARVLVRQGRKAALKYDAEFGEEMPVGAITRALAQTCQEATQRGGVRPFGVSMLVAGWPEHEDAPQLWQVDPSGSFFRWHATAIGRNFQSMKTFLEKRFTEGIALEDAIHTAVLTLKEGFEGELTPTNVELGVVTRDGFRVLSADEVKDYLEF